eukprot:COSAG05_NODE_1441_length_4880_cov_3.567245_7_plen_77_part_00
MFYAAAAANHPELSDSYVQAMLEFMPKARESAREEFKVGQFRHTHTHTHTHTHNIHTHTHNHLFLFGLSTVTVMLS